MAHPIETAADLVRRAGAAPVSMAQTTPPRAGRPTPPEKVAKKFRHPSSRIVRPSAGFLLSGTRAEFGRAAGPGFRGIGVSGGRA
jgi:hypothetical protein